MAALRTMTGAMALWYAAATPTIKPFWSGQFTGIGGLGRIEMDVSFDLRKNRFEMNQLLTIDVAPDPIAINTSYCDDPSGWTKNITMNGTHCFPDKILWPQVLHDFGFGWLRKAHEGETTVVAGKPCRIWSRTEQQRYDWSACIDDDGIPRRFAISAYSEEVGSSMASYFSFSVSLKQEPSNESRIVSTDACANWPPPLCPNRGVKTMDVYRDTSFITPSPDNQDGGDAKAQSFTTFVYKSRYVTVYQLTHNTSYSQYALCNYISNGGVGNHCIGGGKTVGRTPLFHVCGGKPQCGQCTPNEDTGSWLSFPREGRCALGQAVGTDDCTWKATLKKALKYDCVMDDATKAACARSFLNCASAFKKQIASCPGISPLYLEDSSTYLAV